MNILNVETKFDEASFQPVAVITCVVPLEALTDGQALVGRQELINILGTEFLNAYENYKERQK